MEGRRRYGRGSGGGMAQDAEAALSATTADRTGGGCAASDRRREMKEERAKWAADRKWKTKTKMELGWAARDIWAKFKLGH
jgi:hypothetical protein